MPRRKRSLGRDVFEKKPQSVESEALKKIIEGRDRQGEAREARPARPARPARTRQIDVTVKLSPADLKHLDRLLGELEKRGRGDLTRNDLIRIGISLLSADDF